MQTEGWLKDKNGLKIKKCIELIYRYIFTIKYMMDLSQLVKSCLVVAHLIAASDIVCPL